MTDLPDGCRRQHPVQSSREKYFAFTEATIIGRTATAAWRSKPSYYAVSTEDRTIDPDLQRFMAKRMGATTIDIKASHLGLISHPDEIARLILQAAGQQPG